VTGDTTTARTTASVLSWIKSNTSTTGTDPTTSGTVTRVDGTQRAFTEAQVKTVLSAIWTAGGKPDTIMAGAFNKQQFSTFTGRASPTEDTKSQGHRCHGRYLHLRLRQGQGRCEPLPADPRRSDLADGYVGAGLPPSDRLEGARGDGRLGAPADPRRICLVSRNEKASGGVYDLTTS
jgi:hypothetical protein